MQVVQQQVNQTQCLVSFNKQPLSEIAVSNVIAATSAPAKYVKDLAVAKKAPMRLIADRVALKNEVHKGIGACLLAYTGVHKPTPEMLEACTTIIGMNYQHLAFLEVKAAFDLAVAKKIEVNLAAYYGDFTAVAFGELMAAYDAYRKNVAYQIQKNIELEGKAEQEKADEAAKEARNEKAYERALAQIGEIIRIVLEKTGENPDKNFHDFLIPYELPADLVKILTKKERVELLGIEKSRKKELWKVAHFRATTVQEQEIKELRKKKTFSPACDVAKKIAETADFDGKWIDAYSYLLVYEHIKMSYYEALHDSF